MTRDLTEAQYKVLVTNLIQRLEKGEINPDTFNQEGEEINKRSISQQIADFEDEDLGWIKYWLEEIDYYGFEEILNNKFNFFKELKTILSKDNSDTPPK